jgi:hypothetical protein
VRDVERAGRDADEGVGEPELLGRLTDEAVGRVAQQPLARAVDQPQDPVRTEREHRDVDLLQHLAQRLRGLDRAEALIAQDAFQRVHLLIGERQ